MANPEDWIYEEIIPEQRRALERAVLEMREVARLMIEEQPLMSAVMTKRAKALEDAFGFECNRKD